MAIPTGRPYAGMSYPEQRGSHTATLTSASVLALAETPKDKLFTELWPACSEKVYPGALNMDAIDSSVLCALATALDDRIEV